MYRAWQAGFVRRWHTNPHLCDTVDYDAGHQGRVTVLVLGLFPDARRELLIRAVTHDQGEIGVGDVSYLVKISNPEIRPILDKLENDEIGRQNLPQPNLMPGEQKVLKLCDWLDAWLWMAKYHPESLKDLEWMDQVVDALNLAHELGVRAKVISLMEAATE